MSAQQRDEIQQAFFEAAQKAAPTLAYLSRYGGDSVPIAEFEAGRLNEMAWELELISTTIRNELQRRGFSGEEGPVDTA